MERDKKGRFIKKYKIDLQKIKKSSSDLYYWLGFLMADGCVTDDNRFSLVLQVRDSGHIKKFVNFLGSNTPVYYKGNYAIVMIRDKGLAELLKKYGIVPRKSLIADMKNIPQEYKKDFFRGLFDGDGSISYSKSAKSWIFRFLGSYNLVSKFQNWLIDKLNLNRTKIRKRGNVWELQYCGNTQVSKILDLLYSFASVYLERKYAIYQRIIGEQ